MEQFQNKILTRIQKGIPLIKRPFAMLADEFRTTEEDLIIVINDLMEKGVIREIAPIFESEHMGYCSALVACEVESKNLDSFAQFVSDHPGVTHSYHREHSYNLWFTLTIPNDIDFDRTISVFEKKAGVKKILTLPKEKTYKIRVAFNLTDTDEIAQDFTNREIRKPDIPDNVFKKLVCLLQEGLPVIQKPFKEMAKETGVKEGEFIELVKKMHESGIMRRFPAMLRHKKAGIKENALLVWEIDDKKTDAVGEKFSRLDFVTHCYSRKTYTEWKYNLYTMIHSRTAHGLSENMQEMVRIAESADHLVLKSLKEYKKIRMKYFTPEIEQWNKKHLSDV